MVDEDGGYTELGTGHSQEDATAEQSDGSPGKEPSGELGVDQRQRGRRRKLLTKFRISIKKNRKETLKNS
jgi:hypothetical protein